jgi:hypothetical protein
MNTLLDIVEQKKPVFQLLCGKYHCEFACAVFTYKDNDESTPSVHLDKRYHQIAAELIIEYDLDLYAW